VRAAAARRHLGDAVRANLLARERCRVVERELARALLFEIRGNVFCKRGNCVGMEGAAHDTEAVALPIRFEGIRHVVDDMAARSGGRRSTFLFPVVCLSFCFVGTLVYEHKRVNVGQTIVT
jgi:hypothetical protein